MTADVIRLAECRAIIGGERDKFRAVWDEMASPSDRRLLLAMARKTTSEAMFYQRAAWCELPASVRGDVVAGLARFQAWAARMK